MPAKTTLSPPSLAQTTNMSLSARSVLFTDRHASLSSGVMPSLHGLASRGDLPVVGHPYCFAITRPRGHRAHNETKRLGANRPKLKASSGRNCDRRPRSYFNHQFSGLVATPDFRSSAQDIPNLLDRSVHDCARNRAWAKCSVGHASATHPAENANLRTVRRDNVEVWIQMHGLKRDIAITHRFSNRALLALSLRHHGTRCRVRPGSGHKSCTFLAAWNRRA